jgi:hypothetical protein
MTIYLLAACLVLTGMLVLESRHMVRPFKEDATVPPAKTAAAITDTFIAPGIAAFSEITERPLFTPGRRPPPEPEVKAAPRPPPQPLRLRLEGVAISPAARIAIVRDLATNKILRLVPGMKHQGWELATVDADGISFKRGERDQEISLYIEKQTPGSR